MTCSNCGADLAGGSKFCEFCGASISADMKKDLEYVNKEGCPKCGSANVKFARETQGEVTGKKSKNVIYHTVGVCQDCGHTWKTSTQNETVKPRKTWLWVLGWIFIFPVPLMILLLRPTCKLNKILKIVIIAIAWIVYLALVFGGSGSGNNGETRNPGAEETSNPGQTVVTTVQEETPTTTEKAEDPTVDENGISISLKEFLDEYEAVMDEYIAFMHRYMQGDLGAMGDYARMLAKYTEFAEKAEALDQDNMSAADSAYYLEVITRVNGKLAGVVTG